MREYERVQQDFSGESRTVQSESAACDVNKIMKAYVRTGSTPHVNLAQPLYADYTNVPDLATALNAVREAEASFMELPAAVRNWARNDPVMLVQLVMDPANAGRMVELDIASVDECRQVFGDEALAGVMANGELMIAPEDSPAAEPAE